MDGQIDRWMDGWIDGKMDRRTDWMDAAFLPETGGLEGGGLEMMTAGTWGTGVDGDTATVREATPTAWRCACHWYQG